MFQQCEEPRFTIEQIDLLQRLRRTGITHVEVVHALDTLDHLDQNHGHRGTHKASYGGASSSQPPATASSSLMSTATQTSFPEARLALLPSNNFDTTSPPLPISVASPVTVSAVAHNGLVAPTNGKLSPPSRFPLGGGSGGVAVSSYGFEGNEEELDLDEKVEDLIR